MRSSTLPLLIVNPVSGGGRAGRTATQMRSIVERRLGPVDVAMTGGPAHAIDIAREAVGLGRALLVAVGGDGTLHEVANGVIEGGGSAAIGYIGQGTGGDFRRSLGVEHRLDAYIAAIASGRERLIDTGRLRFRGSDGAKRTRWFVNIVSVGMGGLVDTYVSNTTKALGGKAAYFWASARALVHARRGRIRCDVSLGGNRHERRVDSLMMAICNGRYFGSGMHVAPMAELDDGRFEVISLDAPNKLAFAMSSRKVYRGAHLSAPRTVHFGCERIAIDLENDAARDVFLLDVDGEALGGLPLEVDLVPKSLRLRM